MNNQDIRDSIKKKTEDIPVPESLHPEQIEKKLAGKSQISSRFTGKRRTLLAAAVCLALVCTAGIGVVPSIIHLSSNQSAAPQTNVEETSGAYEKVSEAINYEIVCDMINSYNERQSEFALAEKDSSGSWEVYKYEDSSSSSNSQKSFSGTGNSDYSDTDTQVAGIMEGDIVKTDGTHIFTIKDSTTGYTITIYTTKGGKGSHVKKLSNIAIEKADCAEMYIEGSTLILLSRKWYDNTEASDDKTNSRKEYAFEECAARIDNETRIDLYDISHPEDPKEIRQLTQSGSFSTSRLSNGYLYTFSNYVVEGKDHKADHPNDFVPQINGKSMSANKIRLLDNKGANTYMVMTSLKIEDSNDFADSAAALGSSDTYYMNDKHIYVVKDYDSWFSDTADRSTIVKYTYDSGDFSYNTSAQVRGRIEDSYYMYEYKDNFIFVYTKETKNGTTNGLCVMDKNLKLIGEISKLGKDEEIYSSYYIDNMAYFVTYRNTDPVFAVDISNPKKPVLKSELKLPGFSSYLHSFGENMLVGIGSGSKKSDSEGDIRVKLSMFSVDEDHVVKEITKKLEDKYTDSYAGSNHKAVFIDEERGLVGLGIESYSSSAKSKYVVYQYKNGTLNKVLSYKIKDSYVGGIRGLRIGDCFYIVDVEGGVEVYDINTWKKAK